MISCCSFATHSSLCAEGNASLTGRQGRDYFTLFAGTFLAARLGSIISSFGGRSTMSQRMAKRSSPIWTTIVEVPDSPNGFGNGKIFLGLLLFIRDTMPHFGGQGKGKAVNFGSYRWWGAT